MNSYLLEGRLRGGDITGLVAAAGPSLEWLHVAVHAVGGGVEQLLFNGGDLALFAVAGLPDSDAAVALLVMLAAGEAFIAGPSMARLFAVAAAADASTKEPAGETPLFLVRGQLASEAPSAQPDGGLATAVVAAGGRLVGCYRAGARAELVAVVSLSATVVTDVAGRLRASGRFAAGLEFGRILRLEDLHAALARRGPAAPAPPPPPSDG